MDLERRTLGKTGIEISQVTLGCGTFGGIGTPVHLIGHGLDEVAAMAAMDEAVALGINLFDTAGSYCGGASEEFIGRWLAAQPEETRAGIHIATKVGLVPSPGGVEIDLSPLGIAWQFTESLQRLGLDRVEFCLSHAPDPVTPIEATLEGFARLIEAVTVRHIGACNVSAEQIEAALRASERLGLPRYEWIQNEYNLLHRDDERDVFALCHEHGLGYTPFSPIAGGVLARKYRRDAAPPPDSRLALRPEDRSLSPAVFNVVDRLAEAALQHGVSAGGLALAWVMQHPQVTSAIAGPSRSPEHLRLVREALRVELDEAGREEIAGWFNGIQ